MCKIIGSCSRILFGQRTKKEKEREGLKETRNKIKEKEIVVSKTDKSGLLCADSISNYKEAVKVHTKDDKSVDWKTVQKIESNMNEHLKAFNRMLNVGSKPDQHGNTQEDRVNKASISTNVPPPPLYILRKDHKNVPPDQENKGPPGRPVCSASDAPNSRFSHFLSKIIKPYADSVEDSHECKSSEEMRSLIDKYNDENSSGDKKKGVIFGMDAKALFPSLRIDSCMRAVKDLIKNSDITEKNLNWWELQKYIAVFYDEETIEAEGLLSVIPKRAKKPRRPLTINCLSNDASKYDDEKWVRAPDTPTLEQKKTIFAMAVAYGCKMVITNHVYTVGDEFFLQSRGGPIGLELTGILARVVMMDWDRRYLKAVSDAGIVMMMLGWYVDDINQIVKCDDGTSPADLIARLLEIANSIEPGIEMEVDICDNHSDQKIPMLDMKCWIDEDGDALYQHFEKSVSTKLIISSRSAHSGNCKRSVHISELVRRMLNFSRKLNWDQFVVPVLNEYMVRMAKAGYHQEYRKNVLLNAFAVYDSKIKKHIDGECPLNRPPGYKKVERQKAKVQKKRNWSTKGGFIAPIIVPSTPDSELAKMLREVAEKESEAGIRFKVVEKGGMTIEKNVAELQPHCKW